MRLLKLLITSFGFFYFICTTTSGYAQNLGGQVLQINTLFSAVKRKPTWLLIIRDMQTGVVVPYLFDIRNNENYWVAFTYGHTYRITASELQFEGTKYKIHNFCDLANGVIKDKSMFIRLTGKLTTNRDTSHCSVLKFKQN